MIFPQMLTLRPGQLRDPDDRSESGARAGSGQRLALTIPGPDHHRWWLTFEVRELSRAANR